MYLGTPAVAVPPLLALCEAGFEVVLVVTGEDRRRGRGGATTPSPVKSVALERGIPIAHGLGALDGVEADLGVVVAYGALLPADLLERLPMVNLHRCLDHVPGRPPPGVVGRGGRRDGVGACRNPRRGRRRHR